MEEVFVINLAKCKKRLQAFDDHMKAINMRYTRWEAVYGNDLSDIVLNNKTTPLCKSFVCTKGIIGCALSHQTLWQHIQKKYAPRRGDNMWFLIFEDDAYTEPGFVENIGRVFRDLDSSNPVWQHTRYPEFIHLDCSVLCKEKKVTSNLFQGHIITGTTAYMLSYNGIERLLTYMNGRVKFHIDVVLTLNQLLKGHLSYYTTHNYITHNDGNTSTLSVNTYPQMPVFILDSVISQYRPIYNSIVFRIGAFTFNAWIFVYTTCIIALLITGKHIWMILVLLLLEVILILLRPKKSRNADC
jgi:GR25 family glycosyltransferase involved in LPS biosynthesis